MKPKQPTDASGLLRRAALNRLDELRATSKVTHSASDLPRLVHELEVHQIELEMQNEALRRTQLELEASQARYVDLYDFAPVG